MTDAPKFKLDDRIEVAYWKYVDPGAKALSARDIAKLNKVCKGVPVSFFRMQHPDHWLIALVGTPEPVKAIAAHVKFGERIDVAKDGEPEPGLSQALVRRFVVHLEQTVETGQEFGHTRYNAGAHLQHDGSMRPVIREG